MSDEDPRGGAVLGVNNRQRVIWPENDRIAAVEPKGDAAAFALVFALHLYCAKRRALDIDLKLLDRRDQDVAPVGFTAKDGGEQSHHRGARDRMTFMVPRAVAGDPHPGMAAALGIPLLHRRQPPLVDQLLELCETNSSQFNRRAAFGH